LRALLRKRVLLHEQRHHVTCDCSFIINLIVALGSVSAAGKIIDGGTYRREETPLLNRDL